VGHPETCLLGQGKKWWAKDPSKAPRTKLAHAKCRSVKSRSSSCRWLFTVSTAHQLEVVFAILVKFNASPTVKKYRRCRSSTAHFLHAAKAWLRNKHGIGPNSKKVR
jgi:hypothetical protein